MTTDMDGDHGAGDGEEIALPRFEERLRLRLGDAHREQSSDAGPSARRSHRRAARRSLWIGTGGIAAAAAALVVAVVAREPDPATDRPGGEVSDRTADAPRTEDLATLIIAATEEAESTMVVYVRQDNSNYGDDENWFDETTGGHRFLSTYNDGAPSFDYSLDGTGERHVDYCFSEYTEGTAGLPAVPGNATGWVQNMLEKGLLVEDGTEVVDGRELIRLKEVLPTELSPGEPDDYKIMPLPEGAEADADALEALAAELDAAQAAATVPTTEPGAEAPATTDDEELELGVTLVDPDTYRPVIVRGYPGSDAAYVQTYEYLPRTPENLAHLSAPVPPGFTQVDQLRGDGERFDAGCI